MESVIISRPAIDRTWRPAWGESRVRLIVMLRLKGSEEHGRSHCRLFKPPFKRRVPISRI
ncbi:MAG: hypothetical protein ICV60_16200 [Pyrinomonadaceae bacterium]|nr:hypothetical protein [Pyrinomonadaceae bacterium]